MRLLKFNDNDEPSMIKTGNNIPEYAILSHTWADGEEATFEDLVRGIGKDKPGYNKIKFCVNQANQDGLQYSWVDTCCIDKSSSAELSEAINSMFRWYSKATRCYVYLSDVPDPKDPTSTIESALPGSRWFKRGWTLQELIAPSTVQFFSRENELLGDRKSRGQQIHQITGIATEALQGKPLSQFNVDERLSWAARRETTVEEDAAYCLLGIFDIRMPLIYGEGRKKALERLQRKIQKASNTASLVSTDAPWIVPFKRNPRFTGCEPQLTMSLHTAAPNGDEKTAELLFGIGTDVTTNADDGQTVLHKACLDGQEEVVRQLLLDGANIEAKDKKGWTPLLVAAENERELVVKILIERGADPDVVGAGGSTSLLLAIKNEHEGIVKILVQRKVLMDIWDSDKHTPLSLAVYMNNKNIVELLLKSGAGVDFKLDGGWTPLHFAVKWDYVAIAELLLKAGAEVDWAHPNQGWSPLYWALERKSARMAKLLISWGANVNWRTSEGGISVIERARMDGLLTEKSWRQVFEGN